MREWLLPRKMLLKADIAEHMNMAQRVVAASLMLHREKALRRSDIGMLIGRTSLSLACVIIAGASMAQSSGKIRLQIDPQKTFTYKLDHRFTMQEADLELLEGPHHFSFWAPQRKVVDTTITMVEGTDKVFSLRLPFSTEYLVYQRDLRSYRKDMRVQRLLPVSATGLSLIYTAVKFGQLKKAHDKLESDRTAYNDATSPYAITYLKGDVIPVHQDEFDKARSGYRVAAGITILFAGVTTYMYLRSAKRPKPEFRDSEKVRFDGLSWAPGVNGGEWNCGLTWNFTR